jgi:hypothetical protein
MADPDELTVYRRLRKLRGELRAVGLVGAQRVLTLSDELRQVEERGEFGRAVWLSRALEHARENADAVRTAFMELDGQLDRLGLPDEEHRRSDSLEEGAFRRAELDFEARRVTHERLLRELYEEHCNDE